MRGILFFHSVVALTCAAISAAGICHAQGCLPLSEDVRGRIAFHAAERYQLAPDLRVEGGEVVSSSCFRSIKIQSASPKRSIELFLSPDQRFLVEGLLDTNVDPSLERRRAAGVAQVALLAEHSPSHGPEKAPVTVVEFSDFQCPFCKRAADALAATPEGEREDIRLVFKQRPLAIHQWARRAALTSICASFQSDEAFWAVERFFFANQGGLTAETLESRVREFASNDSRVNFAQMDACLASKSADAVLLRDEKLAEEYHVDAAPTIFINGIRKVGINSPEELWSLLRLAALDARRTEPRGASDAKGNTGDLRSSGGVR